MKKCIAGVLFLLTFSTAVIAQSHKWSVAITVDDMPAVTTLRGSEGTADSAQILKSLEAALAKHKVPATGFVNQQKVEEDGQTAERTLLLDDWLKAGLTLGNHTYSHPKFSELTLEDFEKNTIDGERTLAPLLARHEQKLRFFRFPYNDTGGTAEKKLAFDKFLADRHYEIATCTMENTDWMYDSVYRHALAVKDTKHAAEIRESYLQHTREALEAYEKMSLEMMGRPFPQVMLMHADHLNADSIDEVLTIFEQRGYKFVPLAKAQKDKAYRTPDAFTGPWGIMWQQRWDLTLHRAVANGPTKRGGPNPPKWLTDEYASLPKTGY
jgi:peptidoglycan/xylan/chitin deacetylase (PgdA/CDA1 family)